MLSHNDRAQQTNDAIEKISQRLSRVSRNGVVTRGGARSSLWNSSPASVNAAEPFLSYKADDHVAKIKIPISQRGVLFNEISKGPRTHDGSNVIVIKIKLRHKY